MKGKLLIRNLLLVIACALCASAVATETENLGMQVLPAPGKVAIDGKFRDWDLTGGILACSDAENLRDQYSQWFHTMYDAKNLYVLARWKDPTPLNNRWVKGDHGFAGDCLQFRTVTTDAEENHHQYQGDRRTTSHRSYHSARHARTDRA